MSRLVVQVRSMFLVMAVCTLLLFGMVLSVAAAASAWAGSSVAGMSWDKVTPNASGAALAGVYWDKVLPTTDGVHWG